MPQQLVGPDGPIDTSVWLAGGGLVLAPRTAARTAFELGAGAMAAVVWGTGTDPDMMGGRTDYAVGVAAYGRAALRIRLSPSWSVRLDVLGGSTAPRRAVIVSADRNNAVTAWGVGFVAALAGVELGF
jgi:hypothetical protein